MNVYFIEYFGIHGAEPPERMTKNILILSEDIDSCPEKLRKIAESRAWTLGHIVQIKLVQEDVQ